MGKFPPGTSHVSLPVALDFVLLKTRAVGMLHMPTIKEVA